jgi:hypothetical protein
MKTKVIYSFIDVNNYDAINEIEQHAKKIETFLQEQNTIQDRRLFTLLSINTFQCVTRTPGVESMLFTIIVYS